MAERGSGLGIISEPYSVPSSHPCWAAGRCGSVAITWRQTANPIACTRVEAGDGFVAVRWGQTLIVGVYLSPRLGLTEFEAILDDVRRSVERFNPAPVVVAGDFNAKLALWGSPVTNARGRSFKI
ncbi:uncharacterized protein [Temnothorax nylanderi]|uniref:uncharacterized protein n=1 Tax=Temnothorax nylanderi TaxID=102681 RepID=UPI003A84F126